MIRGLDGSVKGWVFVALGAALFIMTTGRLLMQVAACFVAIAMINYGLKILGLSPLFVLLQQWFDGIGRK